MERTGEVKAIHGEWLDVEFCRPADCEKCNACHGQKQMQIRIKGQAQIGDKAVVSMPEGVVTSASLIVYAIPLLALLAGMALGGTVLPLGNSLGAVIGGIAGLGIAAAGIWLTESRRRNNPKWHPQLVRVIPAEDYNKQ